MKRTAILAAAAVALSACTTTSESTTAAISRFCAGAKITKAALDPWKEAGRLSAKNERIYDTATEALFNEETGFCVAPSGDPAVILVSVSSFALQLSLTLKETRK
jgi:hypothetical protein